MKKTKSSSPYTPADYEISDIVAVQALINGTADEFQQRRVMQWLIEQASGMYQFHYYQTDRDTAFALGRAFVGQQLVKLSKLSTTTLRRDEK